jgi:GTPase
VPVGQPSTLNLFNPQPLQPSTPLNFIDHIRIECRSGKGGKGSSHLRREKYMPKGGPDGGDGGRGGHVIVRGNSQLWTLLHLRYTKHVIAEDGQVGSRNQSSGASGKDALIELPLGTVIKDMETDEVLCEVTEDGEEHILFPGGRGGLGNHNFKTSTNQTPRYAQPGEPGVEKWVVMELKVLADVGLVGFPNAGKSTLLSVVTAAKPKIADYAFTTLTPNLGIVPYRDNRSFVMADIPGIIEGAHEGKGLGLRFLRHIERNSVLLFMIPADSKDIVKEYGVLVNELKEYSPELLDKDRLLAITKCDMLDAEMMEQMRPELPKGIEHVMISSVTSMGLDELKDKLWQRLESSVIQKAPARSYDEGPDRSA